MARRIWVNVESPLYVTVRGHGARSILMTTTGRLPRWSSIARAWVTTEKIARDATAIAERAGFDVIVTGDPSPPKSSPVADPPEPSPEPEPSQGGLW